MPYCFEEDCTLDEFRLWDKVCQIADRACTQQGKCDVNYLDIVTELQPFVEPAPWPCKTAGLVYSADATLLHIKQ